MILNYFSTSELNFSSSWKNGLTKLKSRSNFEKCMTIFWLMAPFIYLIERDPADLWLTLISLIFLVRCIFKNNWEWTSQLWFKSALILWMIGLFSAIISPDPYFSFQQGFVWFRFPLYVAAAQVWLGRDRDIRILMLISIIVGMLLMCMILISEIIIEPKLRLSWPYGDFVPGSYISKFSLPASCAIIAIFTSGTLKRNFIMGFFSLIVISVSFLTGERTNFLIKICSNFLSVIFWRPKKSLCFIFLALLIMILSILLLNRPDLYKRYGKQFIQSVPTNIVNEPNIANPYWGAWRGGIQQGLITPIFGIGPSGTRNTCANLDTKMPKWLPGTNYCGNHPHNFYIQLFAETGIFGLIVGCVMFGSIILCCIKARKENFDCPMAATAFIIPCAFFFPIQQFGSFFGQWGNLFTWFAIAFAVSQYQGWRKKLN